MSRGLVREYESLLGAGVVHRLKEDEVLNEYDG